MTLADWRSEKRSKEVNIPEYDASLVAELLAVIGLSEYYPTREQWEAIRRLADAVESERK